MNYQQTIWVSFPAQTVSPAAIGNSPQLRWMLSSESEHAGFVAVTSTHHLCFIQKRMVVWTGCPAAERVGKAKTFLRRYEGIILLWQSTIWALNTLNWYTAQWPHVACDVNQKTRILAKFDQVLALWESFSKAETSAARSASYWSATDARRHANV